MGTSERGFDFSDFFHLFMDSFVANLRDCLLEWLNAATATASTSSSTNVLYVCIISYLCINVL